MFGKNPQLPPDTGDGSTLKVVSIFKTIQGEGPYSGWPAIFIRLQGCNLACTFCDTDFDTGTEMDLDQIIDSVLKERGKDQIGLVVLTGGEPVRQPIHLLVIHLISKGFTVQVETAGTLWNECLRLCKVVVSPKTAILNEKIQEVAFAFKYIIRCTDLFASEDGLPLSSTQKKEEKIKLARPKYPEIPIFLSPCDEYDVTKNKANLQACIARGIQHGYIVGIQLHKYLGLQ